jgi:hypothetical protein
MSNDDKILIPNTFQTPNALVDEVMPNVSGPAFKALLAITRLTLGWNHLGAVEISLDKLRKRTGLSRQGVIDGLRELKKMDLVIITKGPRNSRVPNHYALNLNLTTGELVHSLDQSKLLASATSPQFRPQLVHNSDSLKPRKPNKKESTESDRLIPDSISTKSKRKLTRPDPDDRVKPFLTWFAGEYERRIGAPYAVKWEKEGKLIKELPPAFDLPRLKDLAVRFFESPDPWVRQNGGFTVGVFISQINKLTSIGPGGNGNGQAKPVQVKDLSNGMVEVDGVQMDRRIYERRHGQHANA